MTEKKKFGWGGRREGAGRPKTSNKVAHKRRPRHDPDHPVLVTIDVAPGMRSMREPNVSRAIASALYAASVKHNRFRIVHFGIRPAELRFLVESSTIKGLAFSIRGLLIRLSRAINTELGRGGRLFGDRYDTKALTTPAETRAALVTLLCAEGELDPCSSGPWFDGWVEPPPALAAPCPVSAPVTALLSTGWRRIGLLRPDEKP
jgi:hypothetical protein